MGTVRKGMAARPRSGPAVLAWLLAVVLLEFATYRGSTACCVPPVGPTLPCSNRSWSRRRWRR
ncbi:MAG TPA: hypothetical protein VG499_03205 [Actinomycetota bacterium]|nr:hypothetical protein [Actinomycetota bacterium]